MLNSSSNKLAAVFLVLLFILNPSLAYAEDLKKGKNSCNEKIENCAHVASSPQCMGSVFTAAIAAVGGLLLSAKMAYSLIYAPEGTGTAKMVGMGMLAVAGTAIGYYVTQMPVACALSYVRDPKAIFTKSDDPDYGSLAGQMKKVIKVSDHMVKYEATSDYDEAANAPYSNYIRVCMRNPGLIFGGLAAACAIFNVGCPIALPVMIGAFVAAGAAGGAAEDPEKFKGIKGFVEEEKRFIREVKDSAGEAMAGSVAMLKWLATFADASCILLSPKPDEGTGVSNSGSIHTFEFKSSFVGSKVCAILAGNAMHPFPMAPTVGCHYREPAPPAPMCSRSVAIRGDAKKDSNGNPIPGTGKGKIVGYDNAKCFSCYISASCYSATNRNTQAFLPVTSVIVQCIKDSMDLVLYGCMDYQTGGRVQTGFLRSVQIKLKKTVHAVLVLAVIIFAMKIILSSEMPKGPEMFMLLLKFVFVIFLTKDTTEDDGMALYSKYLQKISLGLSELVLDAGNDRGLCAYKASDYVVTTGGKTRDYSYLMIWDKLDCRLAYYIGSPFIKGGAMAATGIVVTLVFFPLMILCAAIFALDFILFILMLIYFVILITLIIWIVYVYIMAIVAFGILILVSPLFIPMILFSYTKNFFDGWLKEIIAYSIYPIILFAFLGFTFTVFDDFFFGETKFEEKTAKILSRNLKYYFVDGDCDTSALGCMFGNIKFASKPLIFNIKVTQFTSNTFIDEKFYGKLLIGGLLMFLLFNFVSILTALAAELAGGSRAAMSLGDAGSFYSMAGKGIGKVLGGAKKAGGLAAKAGKAGLNAAKGGGKEESKPRPDVDVKAK
jgi:type IV secretion system protein VirB6